MKIARFFMVFAGVFALTIALTSLPPKGAEAQLFSTKTQLAATVTQQDTTKVALAVQAIGKKKELLKKEIARAPLHSMEDVYLLQIKTWQTLEDSHKISVMELQNNDSLRHELKSARIDIEQNKTMAAISLKEQRDMRREILTSREFKIEMDVLEGFLEKSAYFVSILSILFFLCRILMRRWHNNNRHLLPKRYRSETA
jgi:hypothetical protein